MAARQPLPHRRADPHCLRPPSALLRPRAAQAREGAAGGLQPHLRPGLPAHPPPRRPPRSRGPAGRRRVLPGHLPAHPRRAVVDPDHAAPRAHREPGARRRARGPGPRARRHRPRLGPAPARDRRAAPDRAGGRPRRAVAEHGRAAGELRRPPRALHPGPPSRHGPGAQLARAAPGRAWRHHRAAGSGGEPGPGRGPGLGRPRRDQPAHDQRLRLEDLRRGPEPGRPRAARRPRGGLRRHGLRHPRQLPPRGGGDRQMVAGGRAGGRRARARARPGRPRGRGRAPPPPRLVAARRGPRRARGRGRHARAPRRAAGARAQAPRAGALPRGHRPGGHRGRPARRLVARGPPLAAGVRAARGRGAGPGRDQSRHRDPPPPLLTAGAPARPAAPRLRRRAARALPHRGGGALHPHRRQHRRQPAVAARAALAGQPRPRAGAAAALRPRRRRARDPARGRRARGAGARGHRAPQPALGRGAASAPLRHAPSPPHLEPQRAAVDGRGAQARQAHGLQSRAAPSLAGRRPRRLRLRRGRPGLAGQGALRGGGGRRHPDAHGLREAARRRHGPSAQPSTPGRGSRGGGRRPWPAPAAGGGVAAQRAQDALRPAHRPGPRDRSLRQRGLRPLPGPLRPGVLHGQGHLRHRHGRGRARRAPAGGPRAQPRSARGLLPARGLPQRRRDPRGHARELPRRPLARAPLGARRLADRGLAASHRARP